MLASERSRPAWFVDLTGNTEAKSNRPPVPFVMTKLTHAIDVSGSTSGKILEIEKKISLALSTKERRLSVVPWSHSAGTVVDTATFLSASGGTEPATLLQNERVRKVIQDSGAWVLITDGEISSSSVQLFAQLIESESITHIPIVIIMVGGSPSYNNSRPANANVSVGLPLFAVCDHSLFLYVDYTNFQADQSAYLFQSKGCFSTLKESIAITPTTTWSELPVIAMETLKNHLIPVTAKKPQGVITLTPGLSINLEALLAQKTLDSADWSMIFDNDEARKSLLLTCKTRGCIPKLRDLINRNQVTVPDVRLTDEAGVGKMVQELQELLASGSYDQEYVVDLKKRIARGNLENEATYRENVRQSRAENGLLREKVRSVQIVLGELAEIERLGFSSQVLGRLSNRAMRAEKVSESAQSSLLEISASLDKADTEGAFRAECPICFDEDAIMSITLTQVAAEHVELNTNDFCLDFPFAVGNREHNDVLSSQMACIRCASYCLQSHGTTTVRENATVSIPLIRMHNNNTAVIWKNCLSVGLTNGLKVGTVVPLFISILYHALGSKGWLQAGADDQQSDNAVRRRMFEWALNMLVHTYHTKHNFQESGKYVPFPEAIEWMFDDCVKTGYQAFGYRYPMSGFVVLFDLAKKIHYPQEWANGKIIAHRRIMLLLIDNYMRSVLRSSWETTADQVKRKLYRYRYSAPIEGTGRLLVNLADSTLPNYEVEQIRTMLRCIGLPADQLPFPAATTVLLRRLIEIKAHNSITGTLTDLRSRYTSIVHAFERPEIVTERDALDTLHEMFVPENAVADQDHSHIPFATPYGPSVIRCACGYRFLPAGYRGSLDKMSALLRKNRAAHFREVYRCQDPAGLPQRVIQVNGQDQAPNSISNNLSKTITRCFHALSQPERDELLSTPDKHPEFHQAVLKHLSQHGRGNIYDKELDQDVGPAVSSFFERVAEMGYVNELGGSCSIIDKLKLEIAAAGDDVDVVVV